MLQGLKSIFENKKLRCKLLWTILVLAFLRVCNLIIIPNVDITKFNNIFESNSLLAFYNLLIGGALSKFTILSLGLTPFINASVLMQLLGQLSPRLKQLKSGCKMDRDSYENLTKLIAYILCFVCSILMYIGLSKLGLIIQPSISTAFVIILSLIIGSTLMIKCSEMLTKKGLASGISLIMFSNMISQIPSYIGKVIVLFKVNILSVDFIGMLLSILVGMITILIVLHYLDIKIPVNFMSKYNDTKFKSYMPFGFMGSAVSAVMFSTIYLSYPQMLHQVFPNIKWISVLLSNKYSPFNPTSLVYMITFGLIIIVFSWVCQNLNITATDISSTLYKSNCIIPGIRPGDETVKYLNSTLAKTSIIGGLFTAMLAVIPMVISLYKPTFGLMFSGTSVILFVSVCIEIYTTIKAELATHNYSGFLSIGIMAS